MNEQKKQPKNMRGKLYQKMIAMNMTTSLIPLVLFSIFSLYTFNNNYLRLINRQYSDAIDRSSAVFSYYLDQYYNIVELNADEGLGLRVSDFEDALTGQEGKNAGDDGIAGFLDTLCRSDPYIMACMFADEEGKSWSVYREDTDRISRDPGVYGQEAAAWGKAAGAGDAPFLLPVEKVKKLFDNVYPVLVIGKRYETLKVKGTLYIAVDAGSLGDVFQDKEIYGRGYLRVLDERGRAVYEREQDVDRRAASIAANLQQLVFSKEVPQKGLTIAFSIDKVTVMADVYVLRGLMISVILCCVTLVLIVSFRLSRQMTRPISQMMEKMDRLQKGDFSVRLPVETNDEIGILSQHFNKMSQQLELYIEKFYVAQLNEKEAELTALKSQIYPHFLYNTLEVIRMAAFEQNDQKVADMIEALSGQMRYIIGTAQDMVPLKMETELLRKYIWLINCRYEGGVRFETETDGFQEYMIPKMILQPIVENAFFHGLKPKGGQGVIELTGEEVREDLVITVMDNGVGMSQTAKAEMKELLSSDRPGNKEEYSWQSIGLKNVHDRLRHLFGPQYGLTFVSHEGMGTAISIRIPKKGGEDFHVDNAHSGR